MSTLTCTTPDCDRPIKGRGLCNNHFLQHYRRGTLPAEGTPRRTVCIYVDCDKPHRAHNLCSTHYGWQHKPVKGVVREPYCTEEGCNRPHQARGLCSKHYNRSRRPEREIRDIAEDREKFLEEYEFFRSWRMTDERLAECLHITVDALHKRIERWVTTELQVAS